MEDCSEVFVNQLLKLLKDPDANVRCYIAEVLGNMRDQSKTVSKELLGLLKDEHLSVRFTVAAALEKSSKSNPEVQVTLLHWIEQHSDLPNLGSIDVLWQICA